MPGLEILEENMPLVSDMQVGRWYGSSRWARNLSEKKVVTEFFRKWGVEGAVTNDKFLEVRCIWLLLKPQNAAICYSWNLLQSKQCSCIKNTILSWETLKFSVLFPHSALSSWKYPSLKWMLKTNPRSILESKVYTPGIEHHWGLSVLLQKLSKMQFVQLTGCCHSGCHVIFSHPFPGIWFGILWLKDGKSNVSINFHPGTIVEENRACMLISVSVKTQACLQICVASL